MIAAFGGTRKVIGNRIATPLTDPSPGIAPMNRPTAQPRTSMAKLIGWKASAKPPIKWTIRSSTLAHSQPLAAT
jgi:hypothetical protein